MTHAPHEDSAIDVKLARIGAGLSIRVLDLFAGCGGLSLGFQKEGFEISAGVELDREAARSHALNFHSGDARHSRAVDVTETSPQQLCSDLELGEMDRSVDVIVGGPPCQAFARVGRAKLREVDAHPEAFLRDPRAMLYKAYLDYVSAFRPVALLMENVPDMLNHGGQNIAEEVCIALESRGYRCRYTLLNSVFYGVPQMRERMFLVAYHESLGIAEPSFPEPTRHHTLPVGYAGSRQVALKLLDGLFGGAHRYVDPPASREDLPGPVTAAQAIGDLPPINARLELREGRLRRGARRFDRVTAHYDPSRPLSEYGREMRSWSGFEAPEDGLRDHQIRYLPRDYELFAAMRPGSEYPELHALAMKRFREAAEREGLEDESDGWNALKRKMVPPYDPGKFPNKWWKMRGDLPVRTLMAHLGKDSYSHIHYDGAQARTVSVREAARLQSFPDGFRFAGTMNPAFRQIGNAVPPLMAAALAATMRDAITESVNRRREAGTPEISVNSAVAAE